jgi:hypothetical protein
MPRKGCKPLGLSVGLEGQDVRAVHTGLLRADRWVSVTWLGEALNRLEHISVLRKSRGWTKVRDLQRRARLSMLSWQSRSYDARRSTQDLDSTP